MFIWKDMWKGRPPKSPQVAAARRRFFLALHDLPKTGWACYGANDMGDDSEVQCWVCGTCIRYPHLVTHWNVYDEDSNETIPLYIGCECAGAVTGLDHKADERAARNRGKRRRKWLERRWNVSRQGNPYLRVQGCSVAVFQADGGQWNYAVKDQAEQVTLGPAGYETMDAAKLAAFDHLNPLQSRRPSGDPIAEMVWELAQSDPELAEQELRKARHQHKAPPAKVIRAMERYQELL